MCLKGGLVMFEHAFTTLGTVGAENLCETRSQLQSVQEQTSRPKTFTFNARGDCNATNLSMDNDGAHKHTNCELNDY
jgi:hypothetical protein